MPIPTYVGTARDSRYIMFDAELAGAPTIMARSRLGEGTIEKTSDEKRSSIDRLLVVVLFDIRLQRTDQRTR